MTTQSENHYFVPNPSLYPALLSLGMFLLASGFVIKINSFPGGGWMMTVGALLMTAMIFRWIGHVIAENESGSYRRWEDKSFRSGMIVFISSEVVFFAAFLAPCFICARLRYRSWPATMLM